MSGVRSQIVVMRGGLLAGILGFALSGCAGDPSKPSPAVTPEQVRGHADKSFDKLRQEEQGRAADQSGVR